MEKRFAFLCHPLDFQHLADVDRGILKKSPKLVRQIMAQLPPNHVRSIRIESPTGAVVQGELIAVWLLPDQFLSLDPRLVQTKLQQALEIAEGLGCDLVGLGAYTKIAASDPDVLSGKKYSFPITTGNTYTAGVSIRALEGIIESRGLIREDIEMTVVGATGAIGNAVMRALAPRVGRLNLVGRSMKRLELASAEIRSFGCEIALHTDAKFACLESDLIFLATSEPGLLIQAKDLAYQASVVDISKPVNIMPDPERPDVRILDCAMIVSPPRAVVANYVRCFPDVNGLDTPDIFACFAETMMLALEGRMEAYSQGGRLDLRKIPEILSIGLKHGFHTRLEVPVWTSESSKVLMKSTRVFGIAS